MSSKQEIKNLVGSRLKALRKSKDLNQEDIGDIIGQQKAAIGKAENGETAVALENLLKLAKHFGISVGYFFGEEQSQEIIRHPAGNIYFVEEEQVRAGLFGGYNNVEIKKDNLPRVFIPGFENGELYMFHVRGDSMKPFITNGDMLITSEIKDATQITPGHPYVFSHPAEGIIVKRLYKTSNNLTFEARSDNPDYPPFEVTLEQHAHVYIVKGVLTANTSKR